MPTATTWLAYIKVCQIPQAISLLMGDIGKKAGPDHAVHCLVSICLVVFSYVLRSCKETGLEEAFEGRGDDVFPEEDLGMLRERRLRPRRVRRQQQRRSTAQGWRPAAGDGKQPVQLRRGQKDPQETEEAGESLLPFIK